VSNSSSGAKVEVFDNSISVRQDNATKGSTIRALTIEKISRYALWLLVPLTFGLAITRQSLWIDEGYTVWFAAHRSPSSFFSALVGTPGSPGDPQLIFYLAYVWTWVKVFGQSELALRAANIPFAVLFVLTMGWASRHLFRELNLWALFCLSPFFWFYLNEARPYIALMTFAAVALVALLAYLLDRDKYRTLSPWICLIALLLASGSHILSAFLYPSLVVLACMAVSDDSNVRRNFVRDWSRPILFLAPAFVALAIFFLRTSRNGVNMGHGESGPSNLAYALYEFLGFGGLGPPRVELRENPHLSAFVPYWPWILLGSAALLAAGVLTCRSRPPRVFWYCTASLVAGVAFAVAVSRHEHFLLLGRHIAVFFPLLLITLVLWANPLPPSGGRRYASITALVTVGIVWMISDIRLTQLSQYQKDDYRNAVSIAEAKAQSHGGKILWAADPHTAHYYGLLVTDGAKTVEIGNNSGIDWHVDTRAVDARDWEFEEVRRFLSTERLPAILVLSKSDLFDTNHGWHTLIQQRKALEVAHLTAFSMYELQPTNSSPDE
jgi:hypothetical protein